MIITCESCETQYAVPSEAIPPEGKKVKCTACGHIWHQVPLEALVDNVDDIEAPPDEVEDIPSQGGLPVVPELEGLSMGTKVVCIVWIIIAIATGLAANPTMFPAIGEMLGMVKTEGVVFKHVKVERNRANNRIEFLIDADIENISEEVRHIGNVKATVYSKGDRVMGTLDVPLETDKILPGEVIHITPTITNVSGNAHKLVLDMGNSWDMMFR